MDWLVKDNNREEEWSVKLLDSSREVADRAKQEEADKDGVSHNMEHIKRGSHRRVLEVRDWIRMQAKLVEMSQWEMNQMFPNNRINSLRNLRASHHYKSEIHLNKHKIKALIRVCWANLGRPQDLYQPQSPEIHKLSLKLQVVLLPWDHLLRTDNHLKSPKILAELRLLHSHPSSPSSLPLHPYHLNRLSNLPLPLYKRKANL